MKMFKLMLPAVTVCVLLVSRGAQAEPKALLDGIRLGSEAKFPGGGFASMGVFASDGTLIRSLSYAQPVQKGRTAFDWDGTTDLGIPAAAGDYTVRGVWFPEPPKIDYQMKVGVSGNPPYLTDSETSAWGGNLGGPSDISTNGKNILTVFGCVESPRLTGIQIMDMEGKVLRFFSSFFPWDVRFASAMDDKNFYIALAGYGDKRLVIGKYDIENSGSKKILCDIPTGDHKQQGGVFGGRWITDVRGLALDNGKLYVPVFLDNKLFVVDTNDGKILQTVDVPSPRGVVMKDGHGYLLSGNTLIRIDADGKTGAEVIKGLDDPRDVSLDDAGNIYISENGVSQQVKVYSRVGKLLREIGVKGGTPASGLYNPKGLNNPKGLCITPDGNVWVATGDIFQEVSVWNPQGERVKTFYNAEMLSGQGRLSPDRSELLVGYPNESEKPGLRVYKLDWKNNTWEPSWSLPMPLDRMTQEDVFLGNGHIYGQTAEMHNKRMPYLSWSDGMMKADNGKTYLFGGDFSIWLLDEKTKEPKLASFVYTHRAEKLPDGRYQGDYDRPGAQNWFAWADLNGDGKMALYEVLFTENVELLKPQETRRMESWQLNPDLSIYFLAIPGEKRNGERGDQEVYLLKPKEILPNGVPVYDWMNLEKVVTLNLPDFKGGEEGGYKEVRNVMVSNLRVIGDSVYVLAAPGSKKPLKMTGVDGDGWWGSRNWRMSPMRFDLKTGEPAWLKLGRRAAGVAKPGEMYYPGWGLSGAEDGIAYFADTLSQVWAWTHEGLYLGGLYNEGASGIFDANSLFIELTGAYVYKFNGKTYVLAGDHGLSVHEIKAPTLTPISAGKVKLTPELAAQAKPWDPDGPTPGKRPIHSARSIYNFNDQVNAPVRTITVDGKLEPAEWGGISPMPINLDGKPAAMVRVTFDKERLYLAYDVVDPNGLKNDGHELPYAPFVSGSYVDFVIGPKWSNPDRTEPMEGDVRIILARITGKTPSDYQMGFWPVKKDVRRYQVAREDPKSNKPQTISSPAQTRKFDDIDAVPGLNFAYQATPWGYTLEVSVPFRALGINPANTPTIGFDASVGFSNPGGQIRTRAAHWGGQSEAVVVDRPGSTELKPATWGTLQLDRNPYATF